MGKRRRRWILRAVGGVFAIAGVFAVVVVVDGWRAMGKAAEGPRLAAMEASPQYVDGGFANPQPLYNDMLGGVVAFMSGGEARSPEAPLPVQTDDGTRLRTPPDSGLRITWLGHSTTVIEIDGAKILTDPIFGERTSPVTWLGPVRWYPPPIRLPALAPVDAVLISHDHYDHLDYPTIVAMKDWDTTFVAPLGVGAHLEYWGVPPDRITEVDWWDTVEIPTRRGGTLTLGTTPARHASGRHFFDQDATLWAGYALIGPEHRVFFSGDTGLFPAMQEIGARWGPFDVAMIEVGAYDQTWPDWHIGPEQAIVAHRWVRGRVFIPIHWGLFDLALHNWTEPIERVIAAAEQAGATVATPRPGESLEPTVDAPQRGWWPQVPWRTAAEYPIRSTKVDASK